MKNLLAIYQNRLKSINELIEKAEIERIINHSEIKRLEIRKVECQSFISDIEREMILEEKRKKERFNEAIKIFKGTNATEINPIDVYNALKIALEID